MYILTIYYFLKFEVNLKNRYDKWHATLQILIFVTLNLSKILPKYPGRAGAAVPPPLAHL